MTKKAICNRLIRYKSAMGVTLIELVVVLVILSILAAAGVGSAIGYLRRSQLTQNDKNAETIYQATQTALLQMEKSGSLEEWVSENVVKDGKATPFAFVAQNQTSNIYLESRFDATAFNSFDPETEPANSSVHMRYLLTYNPSDTGSVQSTCVKSLIQPYFYDATVFSGMITIELDVEKAVDSYKQLHYSAKCLSVFASTQHKNGWGTSAYDGAATTVPTRSYNFRKTKSLVGYYEGYEGSSVDTVYLPAAQEGLTVKSINYDKTTNTISWVSSINGNGLNGTDTDVYFRISLFKGSNEVKNLILNEDFLFADQAMDSAVINDYAAKLAEATVADGDIINGHEVKVDTYDAVYSTQTVQVTRKSVTVEARIYDGSMDSYNAAELNTIKGATDPKTDETKKIMLTVSYVEGELDENGTAKPAYIEYSLNLTPVMTTEINSAKITIWPNDFSASSMSGFNDNTGLIPYQKGKFIVIEHI